MLQISNLSCGYDGRPLLREVTFSLARGELLSLLGPNGVGKTTLFKTLLGLLAPVDGTVHIDDKDLHSLSLQERARAIAYVPQGMTVSFPYTAAQVVMMGRSPWIRFHRSPAAEDHAIVQDAFRLLSIEPLKTQVFSRLSAGQKQLVLIARAIAQTPRFLFLDEPTSSLDFGNQYHVLAEIKRLSQHGIGVIMTTHHPNQVFETGGRVALIDRNRGFRIGDAQSVMTTENLHAAYGISVAMVVHPTGQGMPSRSCLPLDRDWVCP